MKVFLTERSADLLSCSPRERDRVHCISVLASLSTFYFLFSVLSVFCFCTFCFLFLYFRLSLFLYFLLSLFLQFLLSHSLLSAFSTFCFLFLCFLVLYFLLSRSLLSAFTLSLLSAFSLSILSAFSFSTFSLTGCFSSFYKEYARFVIVAVLSFLLIPLFCLFLFQIKLNTNNTDTFCRLY